MLRRTSRPPKPLPIPGITSAAERSSAGAAGRRTLLFLVWGIGLLLLAGCQGDEINKYKVPRAEEKPLNRILGAILPRGKEVLFFKLVGPEKAVKEQEKSFQEFIRSIQFTDEGNVPITWTAPKGWEQAPTPKPPPGIDIKYYAVFDLGQKDLEMTVTGLPSQGVAVNVNRWRGMLGLPKLPDDMIEALTQEVTLAGEVATLVDISGPGSGKRPMGPHGAAGGNHPPLALKGGAKHLPLTYKVPPEWKEVPVKGDVAVVAFAVAENGDEAEVTVSPLRGGGTMLANVNRWRDQLALPRINEQQLKEDMRALTVAEIPAPYVDLLGSKRPGQPRQRILAVSVPQRDQVWFFKMMGQADLVGRQKATFEAFVTSARFQEGLKN